MIPTISRPRLLYLHAFPAIAGLDYIRCRALVESLSKEFDLRRFWGILPDDRYLAASNPEYHREFIRESDFLSGDYEALVIEYTLGLRGPQNECKVPAEIVKRYLSAGGIVLVMFGALNDLLLPGGLKLHNGYLEQAGLPCFQDATARPSRVGLEPFSNDYVCGVDEQHDLSTPGYFQLEITPDYLAYIAPPLRQAFEGVRLLLVSHPLQLVTSPFASSLLVGNPKTTRLVSNSDQWWPEAPYPLFGAVNAVGAGCGVLIGDLLASDRRLQVAANDNLRFVLNLVWTLMSYQRERRGREPLPASIRQIQESAAHELHRAAGPADQETIYQRVSEQITALLERQPQRKEYVDDAREFLEVAARSCWSELEDETRTFLVSGEAAYGMLRSGSDLDFAAAAVPFAKAVETEIVAKIVRPFISYFQGSRELSTALGLHQGSATRPRGLLLELRSDASQAKMPLGTFAWELKRAQESVEPLYESFRNYLREHARDADFWLDPSRAPAVLEEITTRYRNGAAHTDTMTQEICSEWRLKLLGLDSADSWLGRFVSAAPALHP